MKILLFVFIFAFTALAFASNDGCNETSININLRPLGSDDITLTVINDWTLTNKVLGLDILEGPSGCFVLGVDNTNDWIQAYDANSGVTAGTISLHADNGSCFGVAWNNNPDIDTYYTNDYFDDVLYYTEDQGISWTTVTNPAGNSGRGMDFDGTDYWETNDTGGGLWRFQPGVGAQNIAIPEVPSRPSGLTVFPYESDLGVAVTCYSTHNIYFYKWDGSTMDFIGFAACPVSGISESYGLAYAETNGHIYWSYINNSGEYHLTKLSFSILALEQSSWGSIKNSF